MYLSKIIKYLKANPIVMAVVILVAAFFLWKLINISSCMKTTASDFATCVYIDMVQ